MCAMAEMGGKEEKVESQGLRKKNRNSRNTTQAFLRVKGGDKTGRLVDS